jgi:hypothetical protein
VVAASRSAAIWTAGFVRHRDFIGVLLGQAVFCCG